MRLTKRQLKRIIREEYTRLQKRGLINEMREVAAGAAPVAHFAAVCEDMMEIPCGPMSPMYKLFMKIYDCWSRMQTPEECLAKMDGEEMMLFESDFLNCLIECQHPECQEMKNWCYDLESQMSMMGGY